MSSTNIAADELWHILTEFCYDEMNFPNIPYRANIHRNLNFVISLMAISLESLKNLLTLVSSQLKPFMSLYNV